MWNIENIKHFMASHEKKKYLKNQILSTFSYGYDTP